jgi:hypothetical protein
MDTAVVIVNEQIDLFEILPLDESQPCAQCGGIIVTQHFTPGHVESEYVSDEGLCWRCSKK